MIGCLRAHVRKQPIIALYFESETVFQFYNLEARNALITTCVAYVYTRQVDGSIYKFDKPCIIGEFSQKKGGFLTSQEQFLWAYERGYNGAWSWCALDHDDASDDIATQMRGIGTLKDKNDQTKGGRVNINIQDGNIFLYILYLTFIECFSIFTEFFTFIFR